MSAEEKYRQLDAFELELERRRGVLVSLGYCLAEHKLDGQNVWKRPDGQYVREEAAFSEADTQQKED